jgi:hypothetical protein
VSLARNATDVPQLARRLQEHAVPLELAEPGLLSLLFAE